jgi:hypothetical protein
MNNQKNDLSALLRSVELDSVHGFAHESLLDDVYGSPVDIENLMDQINYVMMMSFPPVVEVPRMSEAEMEALIFKTPEKKRKPECPGAPVKKRKFARIQKSGVRQLTGDSLTATFFRRNNMICPAESCDWTTDDIDKMIEHWNTHKFL